MPSASLTRKHIVAASILVGLVAVAAARGPFLALVCALLLLATAWARMTWRFYRKLADGDPNKHFVMDDY